jgi:hypothetical protein
VLRSAFRSCRRFDADVTRSLRSRPRSSDAVAEHAVSVPGVVQLDAGSVAAADDVPARGPLPIVLWSRRPRPAGAVAEWCPAFVPDVVP